MKLPLLMRLFWNGVIVLVFTTNFLHCLMKKDQKESSENGLDPILYAVAEIMFQFIQYAL